MDVMANRRFFERALSFRMTERIVFDNGEEAGMWLTATNKGYDFAYTREAHGVAGRFHHVSATRPTKPGQPQFEVKMPSRRSKQPHETVQRQDRTLVARPGQSCMLLGMLASEPL